jgi:hypothetical protein
VNLQVHGHLSPLFADVTQISQVSVATFQNGVPTSYASLILALSTISVTGGLSNNTAVTVFWGPDESTVLGVTLDVSASGLLGAPSTNWYNWSYALSYSTQLWPAQSVSF